MVVQLNGCISLIEDEELLEDEKLFKNITIATIATIAWESNLIANLFTIKNSKKQQKNLTAMRLKIFMMKKLLKQALIILFYEFRNSRV